MKVVVADTGPLQYLLLVGQIELLPVLFSNIVVPVEVQNELLHRAAPESLRRWAGAPPAWVTLVQAPARADPGLASLDAGEAAAIALALAQQADLVLMDERAGVAVARAKGLNVIGTIGVLDRAADRGLIDVADVVARLKATNFRFRPELLDALVASRAAKRNE